MDLNLNLEFIRAAKEGNVKKAKLLLGNPNTDPSADDNSAITFASFNGHIEVVKLLLNDPRVDPAVSNNWAISWASQFGHIEVVKLLLKDSRTNPATNSNYAIKMASNNDHIEVVKLLLNDPRVDWRVVNEEYKRELIKNSTNQLKNELTTNYLTLNRAYPKYKYIENGKPKTKPLVPKDIIRKTVYLGIYQELWEKVKNSNIPPIKLVALAKLLKVKHNNEINWTELCEEVKKKIYM